MTKINSKLDQALVDLIEAYSEVETELNEQYGDDEEAFTNAMGEILEASIDSALEEQDTTTGQFAMLLSSLSEALEQIDPAAFEEDAGEYDVDDADIALDDVDDVDLDDDEELDELDEDEDENEDD